MSTPPTSQPAGGTAPGDPGPGAGIDAATGDSGPRAPLACGADRDVLLAQVAEGRGAVRDHHQADCPHCTAALAEYVRLWAPFDELAATPTPAPRAVIDRALASIRRQAGPPGWGRVEDGEGSFLVAARVVVDVAGHAARTSPGVRMALGALGELTDAGLTSGAGVGVSGRSVAVDLTVAAEYGQDLPALASRLRSRVVDEVRAQTGLEVVEVDVAITDVFTPTPSARAGTERNTAPDSASSATRALPDAARTQ